MPTRTAVGMAPKLYRTDVCDGRFMGTRDVAHSGYTAGVVRSSQGCGQRSVYVPGISSLIETQASADSSGSPQSVGPYRILDLLGEGGMGAVYLAEQTQPVRRRVALKLIKLGMDTRD